MTQPDPDPTNRELVQVLAEGLTRVHHSERVSIASAALDALTAAGYQIVPKVELEGLREVNGIAAEIELNCGLDSGWGVYTVAHPRMIRLRSALQALDKENDG